MLEKIVGERIILRRLRMSDADAITKYCKDREISKWITAMPHPYKKKDAVWFINDCKKKWKRKTEYIYVIECEGKLAGTVGLHIKPDDKAEIGYWIGRSHWGKGLVTEAARLLISAGFKKLKLHKIYALYLEGNEKSERVMKKLGMKYEAWLRDNTKKNGKYVDVGQYSILNSEFLR
jgi:RimJ/RimL family protein N-acetyltransferase